MTMKQEQFALIDRPRHVVRLSGPCPDGVPPGTVRFSWPASVRKAWSRPENIPGSQWAERYRVMDDDSPRPGPWNNNTSRYLCGMMDAFTLPFVRECVGIAPPQTGKTEVILNCLGYVADRAPGPALMVYPVQDIAKDMCTGRARKLFQCSPRLKRCLTGKQDDLANFYVKLRNMIAYFAWATSVSQLSNKSIRYLWLDEVDKYESTNQREAGPVSLAYKRIRAYKHTSKVMMFSSPTTKEGEISVAMSRVQARFVYVVRCPDCGQYHVMQFSAKGKNGEKCGVLWSEDTEWQRIQAERLAVYVCPDCGSVWDDFKRDKAVQGGQWHERESGLELMAYLHKYRPRSVGFQYSALISPLVSLSETAAKFVLAAQDLKVGRVDAYKDWLNGYMAEVWEDDFSPRSEDVVLALRDGRPSGLVPDGSKVAALLATVDTQDDGFWYEIRAWGFGQECESWQVRAGYVESLDALEQVLWIPYLDANEVPHYVQLAGIDSQGHRTREVYDWCILNRGRTLPINGEKQLKQPYYLKKIETYPGTDKKIPGGLQLLHVNTKYYKDDLHRKLSIAPADPGAWHMHAECTPEWARQMCAEYVDEAGNWVCPKGKPNHAFDVSVYSFCLADYIGTRYMIPDAAEPDEPDEAPPPDTRTGFKRKRW